MGSSAPITFFTFLFLFQVASTVDPKENFASRAGSFVDFPVVISKGANVTDIVFRSKTLGSAIVLWMPDKSFTVINARYSGRVSLQKTNIIRIHNLTMEDGGIYEVEMRMVAKPVQLKTYTLFVFNIITTTERWGNKSCDVNLLCDAGTGKRTQVTYSWKQKETGITLSQNSRLHVIMNPQDEHDVYTCAVQAHGVQSAFDFAPYKCCGGIPSGAAGGRVPGLPSHYLMAKAILVPAAVALLVMPWPSW